MISNYKNLELAVREAILQWINKEQNLSQEMLNSPGMTLSDLKKWLGYWMLARANPVIYRDQLLTQINEFLKPNILSIPDDEIPENIYPLAKELKNRGGTKNIQTSLVSKFAFCLRPELIVPIDSKAKEGLGRRYGNKIENHNYLSYYEAFLLFKDETSTELERSGLLEKLNHYWEPHMSKNLLLARVADKLLMLEGGFSVELMEKSVNKHFGEHWKE